jgi:hypothetical protein
VCDFCDKEGRDEKLNIVFYPSCDRFKADMGIIFDGCYDCNGETRYIEID